MTCNLGLVAGLGFFQLHVQCYSLSSWLHPLAIDVYLDENAITKPYHVGHPQACPWECRHSYGDPMGNVPWDGIAHICISYETQKKNESIRMLLNCHT